MAIPIQHITCAYDGSVNAHWVARYALHLAAASDDRHLRLLHVLDRHVSDTLVERKLRHIQVECDGAGVTLEIVHLQRGRGVAVALDEAAAARSGTMLLAGTRARAGAAYRLRGTVAEQLLHSARCAVLVPRVVQPGLLGVPRRLMLPVAGNPGEGHALAPLIGRLAANLSHLYLMRMAALPRPGPDAGSAGARLRAQARAALSHVETELRADTELDGLHVETLVRLGEEWTQPAIAAAGQYRCGLLLCGLSERWMQARRDAVRRIETLIADPPCDVALWRPELAWQ